MTIRRRNSEHSLQLHCHHSRIHRIHRHQGLDVISRHLNDLPSPVWRRAEHISSCWRNRPHSSMCPKSRVWMRIGFQHCKRLHRPAHKGVRVTGGPEVIAMASGAQRPIGLGPSIRGAQPGSQLALANKESVVAGGHLLFSAQVRGSIVPFRHLAIPALRNPLPISLWSPLRRPRSTAGNVSTWENITRRCIIRRGWGPVTINSSTLMNKGLPHRGVPLVQRVA